MATGNIIFSTSSTTITAGGIIDASDFERSTNLQVDNVSGNINISGGINTSGISTFGANIAVTGNVNASGGLNASGVSNLGSVNNVKITGGSSTQVLTTDGSGNLSWATSYACRAWVNFDGTGAQGTNMTIRGSGNVTSVYANGAGDYTITFTTALPDANYAVVGTASGTTNHPQYALAVAWGTPPTTTSVRIFTGDTGGAGSIGRLAGGEYTSVAIFR